MAQKPTCSNRYPGICGVIRLHQFNTKLQNEASNPAESSSECVKSSSLGHRKASQVTHQPSVRQTPEFTGHFFVPSHTKSGFWSRKSPPAIGQLPAIWWKSADKLSSCRLLIHTFLCFSLWNNKPSFMIHQDIQAVSNTETLHRLSLEDPTFQNNIPYGLKLIISSAADSLSLIYSTGSLQSSGE